MVNFLKGLLTIKKIFEDEIINDNRKSASNFIIRPPPIYRIINIIGQTTFILTQLDAS